MPTRTSTDHLLMSSFRIHRTITRIAYQIFEDTRGTEEPVIFGIDDRGFKLAELLAGQLTEIYQTTVSAYALHIKSETSQKNPDTSQNPPAENGAEPLPNVKDKRVVIVDDVMYSGKTMYKALRLVADQGGPEEIKLAALIDRGHRQYPVDIQYLGLYCPTKLKEHVRCRFMNSGKPDGVWLES